MWGSSKSSFDHRLVSQSEPVVIVEFRCDRARARRWMSRKSLRVGNDDVPIQVAWTDASSPAPAGLDVLFKLERMILRRGKRGGADRSASLSQVNPPAGTADVVVDFTDAPRDPACKASRYLRPRFNGAVGENAALAAILSGDLPVIEIVDEADGTVVDRGHPSAEVASGLSGALDTVMARTMTLLAAVLSGRPRIVPQLADRAHGRAPRPPAAYVLRGIAWSIVREIYRLCCYAPHWHVGWRYSPKAGVWDTKDLSGPAWNVLQDPGNRFFADPFAITWQGRTFAFFEDLDHRVGKGIISAIEFDGTGPVGKVMPVLDESWHLSYPFLLEHDGQLWMIPESSTNNDVAIYRCVRFPDKWERHATLLTGVEIADITITQHNGFYYMFGAWRDGTAGYSDVLAIYHSPDVMGPWTPHASNPILTDRATTRPAGNFVRKEGLLLRPVQDCSESYGGALALAEILELTPDTFRQEIRGYIRPGPVWPGRKLHTLNRCGDLELIDGARIQPRFRAWRG
jgi:hypothetical protein